MQHITGDSSIEVLSAAANELPAYWINAKKMILDEPVHCKNQGLANIEMQVKAQNYTGARSYLYMAGMSMLQYSVKEGDKKGSVNYANVKDVTLVNLMLESPTLFKEFDSSRYIHRVNAMVTDSGKN